MKATLFLVVCVLFSAAARAGDRDCAKVTVAGGDSCANLKLQWNLEACGDDSGAGKGNVQCVGNDAMGTFKTESATYRVRVVSKSGGWGETTWSPGPVTRKAARQQRQAEAPVRRTPAKPVAEPAPKREVASQILPIGEARKDDAKPAESKPAALQFGGYLDAYYAYNFNRPALGASVNGLIPDQTKYRYYDSAHDQLMLNLAELNVHRDAGPVGFRLDVGFGPWIDHNSPGDLVSKYVSQAYIEVIPTFLPRLTIDVGKMFTHMGLEVAHAQDDYNYSRSLTYGYALPFWHMGARALYQVIPSKLTAGFYIYNGWSTMLFDNNTGKTFGGSLSFTPIEPLTLIYNVISGPEIANDNSAVRTVHDLNATYNITPDVGVAFDAVYGHDSGGPGTSWTTLEILAKLGVTSIYKISPRFELYNDTDGTTLGGGPQKIVSATLTNAFDFGNGFETRLELRYDHSDQPTFSGARGPALNDQTTASISLLYKF